MASVNAVLIEGEVLEVAHLEQVILDLLNAPRRTVLNQVLHRVQSLVDSAPLSRVRLQLLPQVSHYLGALRSKIKGHYYAIILLHLPVERVVCQYLELGVGNVPVLIGGALLEDLLIFDHVVDLVFTTQNIFLGALFPYMPEAMLTIEFSISIFS